MNDSPKAQNFQRLSSKRLQTTLEAFRILGHVTNRYSYEYTPEQAQEIVDQLQSAVDTLRSEFGLPALPALQTTGLPVEIPAPVPAPAPVPVPAPAPVPVESFQQKCRLPVSLARQLELADIEEPQTLADIVALQRRVIEAMQERLS